MARIKKSSNKNLQQEVKHTAVSKELIEFIIESVQHANIDNTYIDIPETTEPDWDLKHTRQTIQRIQDGKESLEYVMKFLTHLQVCTFFCYRKEFIALLPMGYVLNDSRLGTARYRARSIALQNQHIPIRCIPNDKRYFIEWCNKHKYPFNEIDINIMPFTTDESGKELSTIPGFQVYLDPIKK